MRSSVVLCSGCLAAWASDAALQVHAQSGPGAHAGSNDVSASEVRNTTGPHFRLESSRCAACRSRGCTAHTSAHVDVVRARPRLLTAIRSLAGMQPRACSAQPDSRAADKQLMLQACPC